MLFDRKLGRALVVAAFALNGLLLMGSSCSIVGDSSLKRELLMYTVERDSAPLWWQDGSRIAVAMPPEGMYVVDAQGSEISIFPPGAPVGACRNEWPFSPDLSPDGSRLAYAVAKEDGRSEIVTSAIDGSDVRRLTKDKGVHVHPTWSPDGTQIAFVSGSRGGRKTLYVMDADGSNMRKISPTIYRRIHPPAWSPDGSRIAFAGRNESTTPGSGTVYTVRPAGSDLVESGETLASPVWSPDGSVLAYIGLIVNYPEAANRIVLTLVDPDGSNRRELASWESGGSWLPAMSWSPDGSKLLFGNARGFSIVSADGTGTPVGVRGEHAKESGPTGGGRGMVAGRFDNRLLFQSRAVYHGARRVQPAGIGKRCQQRQLDRV